MQNKDLPFCIFFVNFIFASRKNKHLREQEAMSNELCITGWTNPTLNTDRPTAALLGSLRRPVSFTLEVFMNPNTRACIAYVAGKSISGSGGSHVYDYSQSRHVSIGGSINNGSVSVYDYDRGCHFSGTLPQLYDYGISAHVTIEIAGTQFKGYDYGSGHHYTGTVNGSSVSIYDYGESQHFNYNL